MAIINNISKTVKPTSTRKIVDHIHDMTGIPKADIRDVVHAYNHFIGDSLASGHGVNLYGVGTIFHRFRKGRNGRGKYPQPDTLIVKIAVVPAVRKRLVKLCAEWKETPEFQEMLKKQRVSPIARFHAERFIGLHQTPLPPQPYQQQKDKAAEDRLKKLKGSE